MTTRRNAMWTRVLFRGTTSALIAVAAAVGCVKVRGGTSLESGGARHLFHRRDGRRGDPDRDARAGIGPDRLGLAGLDDRDPKRIEHVLKDVREARPPRPPGHDPLAHGPLRRGGGPGQAGQDRPLLGPRAARPGRRRRRPGQLSRRPEGRRRAGDRLPEGLRGKTAGAQGGRRAAARRGVEARRPGLRRQGDRRAVRPGQPALRRGPGRPAARPDPTTPGA